MEALLPQISSKHFKQVYIESFLAFKDEPVTQLLIQYLRLFPIARMRCSDPKQVDRLEQTLRLLQTKYSKKPKGESVTCTIAEVNSEIKSEAFI